MASPGPSSVNSMLFETGRYSDITINCGSSTFKVHRAIVCTQSKPLAAAVDGNFKESITKTIELDDDEPEIVQWMLKFLYTSDYSDTIDTSEKIPKNSNAENEGDVTHGDLTTGSPFEEDFDRPLLTNVKVYVIGDKYDIPGLKELAKKKYKGKLATEWNTPAFTASLKLLFEQTVEGDRMLKDVAIKATGEHIKDLVDRGEFASLCRKNGDIAFEVLKASLASFLKVTASEEFTCPYCKSSSAIETVSAKKKKKKETNYYCANCDEYRTDWQ